MIESSSYVNKAEASDVQTLFKQDSFDAQGSQVEPITNWRWSWSCRRLERPVEGWQLRPRDNAPPRVGDVALVDVVSVGNHTRLTTAANERIRLYVGDRLVGVFGNRYATDAFEAEVSTLDELNLLTNAGMLGTVRSRHREIKTPSNVRFLGYLTNTDGSRLNLKGALFQAMKPRTIRRNIVLVVGTGMNSGKTRTAAILTKGLVTKGACVAACKLTGSVSHNDLFELRASSPAIATDFSDYGFPSTYLCSRSELSDLFHTMVADTYRTDPDVV
ncbi:MAG: DUF1611 domain-containing protein, partial [Pirellulales bacterium]|nr:DUF1611 domain-containing protein [Pirellulales bacterium]